MVESEAEGSTKARVGPTRYVRTSPGSHCWYVTGTICGKSVTWLVDSGASPNVISWDYYQNMDPVTRPALHPLEVDLRAADGAPLTVHGEINIDLYIANKLFVIPVIVSELGELEALLGMDFLGERAECKADLYRGILEIAGQEIYMNRQEGPGCCRVRLVDNVVVEPDHEHVIVGHLDRKQWDPTSKAGLVEAVNSFVDNTGLLVSSAVIDTTKSDIILTCANLTDEPVSVSKGTTIAIVHPVQKIVKGPGLKASYSDNITIDDIPEHLKPMVDNASTDLNEAQKAHLYKIIYHNQDIFLGPDGKLGRTPLVQHSIDTGNAKPIRARAYKPALKRKAVIEEQLEQMLEGDQIEPSDSPWASPVVLVTKKDGSPRFCVDYRGLNSVTKKDSYPIPNITDCIDSLSGAKWFSTLDLASGYWQCEVTEEDRYKTAFTTHKGLFQFKVLPFGLTNAPATFERLMERVLNGLQWERCLVYLDDVICFGKTFEEASENLECVFSRLRAASLTLKPKKCNLFQRKVAFLGHVVSEAGVQCDPEKISAVKEWEVPHTVTGVRSYLGFCNYYRRYVKSFAQVASPLTTLTQKNKPFVWTPHCQESFETLKSLLTESPILAYPTQGEGDKFILDTDASNFGIGGVLSQIQDGKERVIAYASKTLSRTQRKYCTTYKELLAVVTFMKHFRHYLLGQVSFTVRTDHSSLRWLMNFKDADGMIARWILSMQSFNFEIIHRRGVDHGNADGLSRQEVVMRKRKCKFGNCLDCQRAKQEGSNDLAMRDCLVQSDSESDGSDEEVPVGNCNGIVPRVHLCAILGEPSSAIGSTPDINSNENDGLGPLQPAATTSASVGSNWMHSWTNAELCKMQMDDPDIKTVICWKEELVKCPARQDLLAHSVEVRDLCGQWSKLEIVDGVLYRRWIPKSLQREQLQLITPKLVRDKILYQLHSARAGGHLGVKRTLMKIRQRFFWPRCKRDVERWCQQCDACARVKPGPGYRAKLHQVPVRNKLDRVAIDILGELPETEQGNKYIVVISDYFTKWTHAIALPDQTAQTIADRLMNEFFSVFGMPKYLHTDQGRQFEANLFQEVCQLLGIEKTRTSPYRPQSDGMVERWNRTIQQMLKSFINENRDDWDDHLPYLCMAYRATPHESTGCSPNLMMFGQENNLPIDVMAGVPPKSKPDIECPSEYVEWLRTTLRDVYQYAQGQLKANAKRQKHYYDIRAKPNNYPVGTYVWRWYPPAAKGKLAKGWTGPYRVMSRPTSLHALLKSSPDKSEIRVHIDSLKPFLGVTPDAWEEFEEEHNVNINAANNPSSDEDDMGIENQQVTPNLTQTNMNDIDDPNPSNILAAGTLSSDEDDMGIENQQVTPNLTQTNMNDLDDPNPSDINAAGTPSSEEDDMGTENQPLTPNLTQTNMIDIDDPNQINVNHSGNFSNDTSSSSGDDDMEMRMDSPRGRGFRVRKPPQRYSP